MELFEKVLLGLVVVVIISVTSCVGYQVKKVTESSDPIAAACATGGGAGAATASCGRADTSGSESSSTPHRKVPSANTSITHTWAIIDSIRSSVSSSIGKGRSAGAR